VRLSPSHPPPAILAVINDSASVSTPLPPPSRTLQAASLLPRQALTLRQLQSQPRRSRCRRLRKTLQALRCGPPPNVSALNDTDLLYHNRFPRRPRCNRPSGSVRSHTRAHIRSSFAVYVLLPAFVLLRCSFQLRSSFASNPKPLTNVRCRYLDALEIAQAAEHSAVAGMCELCVGLRGGVANCCS
jgi:hypothetical protein